MILIDTNIFVYAADAYSEFNGPSRKLLYEGDETLYTTSKNISEFLVVESRMGVGYPQILLAVEEIMLHCEILYPSEESLHFFLSLLNERPHRGKHIHDIEIAAIGLSNNISRLATYNTDDFKMIRNLEVIRPS